MKVNPESLPRELQSAKKRIFNPFFRLCEESLLDSLKEDLKTLGFSFACQKLAKRVIKENFPFTNSLKEGYLNFVEDLVKLEAGFVQEKIIIAGLKTPPYQSGDESPRIYTSPERKRGRFSPAHINLSSERYERKLRTLSPEKFIRPEKSKSMGVPQGRSSLPSLPASKDGEKQKEENIHPLSAHSFFIVLGPKSPPVKIENLEQLRQVMRKIKSCGPMTPEIVWRSLLGLREMTPLEVIERYAEQVTGGPFEGWHKILKGNKWMILFEIRDQKIMFRVGSHKDVYAIKKRREPPDKSRRL